MIKDLAIDTRINFDSIKLVRIGITHKVIGLALLSYHTLLKGFNMRKLYLSILLSGIVFSTTTSAYELDADLKSYCVKMRACALESIAKESIPDEYRGVIESDAKNMCKAMEKQFSAYQKEPQLMKSGKACMRSLAALKCDVMMYSESKTQECIVFDKLVEDFEN